MLYLLARIKMGLNNESSKNLLVFLTKASSGFFWESTWVPKATLATTSRVKLL